MKRIGITGSRGFIGRRIADALKTERNIKVSSFNLPERDLLRPGRKLDNFVKGKDVIIHAAAVNRGTDAEIISGSIVATWNIISAMKKVKSRTKLIYLSSIQAENKSVYGLSKKLTEAMLESFSKEAKVPVVIFRLANVFGEGCRPFYNSAVATFSYQAATGKKISVYKESSGMKINLVYVGDVAELIKKEAIKNRRNKFYLRRIVSKKEITVGRLAGMIESFSKGKKPRAGLVLDKKLYKTYLSYP